MRKIMMKKFSRAYTNNKTSIVDEINEFQKILHTTSIGALLLMDVGLLPDDEFAKNKALYTHEISHAIKNILNGMSAQEAIDKMTEDNEEED